MKIKSKHVLIIIFSIICFITLATSIYKIIIWKIDSNKIHNQINEIQDTVNIEEKNDTKDTEIIKQDNVAPNNPYWNYIKTNLIHVDFNELKLINNHTKGWIQVNGTNINYPFVQTNNNKYYLNHSFNKKRNDAGWVFLDYRNKLDGSDKNTILYAHGRLDTTMFGSLKNILKNGWLDDDNNYIVKLSTEHENTLWQVFSVYHIPTTSDYIQVAFSSDDKFLKFLDLLKNRSFHNFNTTVNSKDKILTLSTCYTNNNKLVLHAKLIKKIPR